MTSENRPETPKKGGVKKINVIKIIEGNRSLMDFKKTSRDDGMHFWQYSCLLGKDRI